MPAKRRVEYDGNVYVVKSDTIEIPNLGALDRFDALIWLNRNTYRKGYSAKRPNPLQGYGGTVTASGC